MEFAPVLIPTLNRYEHFKNCLESLRNNKYSDKTDVFIALDFPKTEYHQEGYEKILRYLEEYRGFKELTVIKREKNLGAVENIRIARATIFEQYDRIIVSEDDNEFSKNFLTFINKGLNKYKDDESIFAVCGYNYPVEMPENYKGLVYKWKGFSAWGYGTWRDKFERLSFSTHDVRNFLRNPLNYFSLNRVAGNYLPTLLNVIQNNRVTGDAFISMELIRKKNYCIFPVETKVRNNGHDGSGQNCRNLSYSIYSNQKLDKNIDFEYPNTEIQENRLINQVLKSYFKLSLKDDIKLCVKFIRNYPKLFLK